MTGRLVVAGVASGVGKTTIVCALLAALHRRGLRVQPFKAGPDYIDPSYHALAAGVPSRNLDGYLLEAPVLRSLFARAAARADISLVEGVMGLYDGRDGTSEVGSTAEVAKLIGAPVLVVIDAQAIARTAGAIALGLVRFDPDLPIAGFLLNRVGSPTHSRWLTESIEQATGLPVLGALPRDDLLALPERHLGLVPTSELAPPAAFFERLAHLAERHFALDRILAIAATARALEMADVDLLLDDPRRPRARIAIARDEAFSFYYEDGLELLSASGAELIPFSPLRDGALPQGVQGVYIGGGFPELYADALAENAPMREAIRRAARCGAVVYGECGGLMYLGRTLSDLGGRAHPMVGLVPLNSVMRGARLTLGYRTLTAVRSSPLLGQGERVRGHEFHWSELDAPAVAGTAAYRLAERDGALEGYATERVLASYVHLHFGSRIAMARRLVATCADAPRLA